jgi:hypothetical protein
MTNQNNEHTTSAAPKTIRRPPSRSDTMEEYDEVSWKNRWSTYLLMLLLFGPLGIIWGMIYPLYRHTNGVFVRSSAGWKWLVAVCYFIILLGTFAVKDNESTKTSGLFSSSSSVENCDFDADVMELAADMMDTRMPLSAQERVVSFQTRAMAQSMRGNDKEACVLIDEAKQLINRYRF